MEVFHVKINKKLSGAVLLSLCLGMAQGVFAAEHLAIVGKDKKQGAIDETGRVVLPLEFKKVAIEDKETVPVVLAQKKGKYGLYDREGKELIAPTLSKVTDVSEGIMGGQIKGKWSFYTIEGKKLPGTYDQVGLFRDGLAPVKIKGRWGYVDKDGKLVIPAQYKEAHSFSEGLAAVKLDKQWSYVKADGTPVIAGRVKKPGDFHQGVAVVDDGWLMDKDGRKYAKLKKYAYVGDFGDNDLALVGVRRASRSFLDYISIGWGWGHGWDGWGVGFPGWGWGYPGWGYGGYGYHHHHHHHHSGWGWGGGIGIPLGAAVPANMYRGYINKKGQEVVSPDYHYVSQFYGDYALFAEEGHWGMVDTKGQVVIPAAYDQLWPFTEGLAAFSFDKKWGFIDMDNKVVIPNHFDQVASFAGDRTTAVEKGKGGIIDKAGQPVAPFREQLKEIGPLMAQRAAFKDPDKKKWGYVDENAQVVIQPEYDEAGAFD